MSEIIYRASEIGGCLKLMVAKRLGYVPMDQSKVKFKNGQYIQELFVEGQRLEDVALARLEEWGWKLSTKQMQITSKEILPGVVVQGHIDATGLPVFSESWGLDGGVVEVKSMRPQTFETFLEKGWDTPGLVQKYKWQASIYDFLVKDRLALAGPLNLVAIESDPEIADEDRRVVVLPMDTPFYSWSDITARVMQAESWVRRGELPNTCDFSSFPCPFFYLHEDEDITEIEDEEFDRLVQEFKEAQRLGKVAKDRENEARKVLTQLKDSQPAAATTYKEKKLDSGMVERLQSVKVQTDRAIVTWYEQMNPGRVDLNKMAEDGIDVGKYKVQDKGWRMRATLKDDPTETKGDE